MLYLIVSIALNASLLLIFRLFTKYEVQNLPAIVMNYLVCYVLGSLYTEGQLITYTDMPDGWWMMVIGLGLTFIIAFNVVAMTVQRFSITIATMMQRMSVIMVVLYALMSFHEKLTLLQGVGLVAGLTAIYLISASPRGQSRTGWTPYLLLPIAAFLMSGVIDISFYWMSRVQLTLGEEDRFATLLFLTAGLFGIVVLGARLLGGMRITGRDVMGGIVLGIPNYFSIYFLQMMLTADLPGAILYPTHNIGILIVSSLVSYFFFQEHFHRTKRVGLVLAILAVLLLSNTS